jgi:hypothetical protein
MGDRVAVILIVNQEHSAEVDELLPDWSEKYRVHDKIEYLFNEVNYGELPHMGTLVKLGIAYDVYWDRGCEFEEGSSHARFTPSGNLIRKTLYASDSTIDICKLYTVNKEASSVSPEYAHKVISELLQGRYDRLQILPWDNQVEYGKKHRLLNLIGADTT